MSNSRGAFARWCFVLVASLAINTGAQAERADTVRVVTEGAYPPFNAVNSRGEPKGFEIDLAEALCERADLACTFTTEEWENLFTGLTRKQSDVIISSVEITPERRKKFLFTQPYYRAPAAFLMQRGDDFGPLSRETLKGKTVGVVGGSVHDQYLETLYRDVVQIRRYGSLEEASLDVGTDRIDVVLGDKFELQNWLNRGRQAHCCTYWADAPYVPSIFGEGYGMVFRKSDKDLRDTFSKALDAVMSDGTYDRIRSRYFPFDIR